MWISLDIIREVDKVARIRYITRLECELWNASRKDNELRLLTGWEWIARDKTGRHVQGFKTMTVAYRNAYYALIRNEDAPSLTIKRSDLRVENAKPQPKKVVANGSTNEKASNPA